MGDRDEILIRLKKIEGQIRGIQRMIVEGRGCEDIFSQMSAINGALKKVSIMMAQQYVNECTSNGVMSKQELEDNILKILKTLSRSY